MLNAPMAVMGSKTLLQVQENSFLAPSKESQSWSHFDREYYPATPPTEELEEDASKHSTQVFTAVEQDSEPLVVVMGVGYVGSHLIQSFSTQYNVLGFDISEKRILEVSEKYQGSKTVRFTMSERELSDATHFLISVPTLLLPDRTIDSSYLRSALKTIDKYGRAGATVVVESSVAVGMTRQLLGPLAAARRFFAGMSPERVDPGRVEPPVKSIPKIISGLDDIVPGSLESISRLYSAVFDTIVPVSRPEVAEMTKLYENCQRMMMIAYANEMADACIPHGVDPYEVCSAAATKPFGYTPFTPGLGVGGHCIPINPYYLLSNSSFPLLQAATEKMWRRPAMLAQRTLERLSQQKQWASGSEKPSILVVGIGFKPGQANLSTSPGLEFAKSLVLSEKVNVSFADTLVPQSAIPQIPRLDDKDWTGESLETFDMIIIAFRQVGIDFSVLSGLQGVRVEMWCR